jgi:hypothetical protein
MVASDVGNTSIKSPLLWLDGIEIEGRDDTGAVYHTVCLGKTAGITREMTFIQALNSAREQGALLVLAHPYWSGNTLEDAFRWEFHGVEVYNHVCHWLNGKSNGGVHWNAMLKRNPDLLAFSVDDAHLRPEHPGWNGGWIAANVTEFSQEAILTAIRRGNFFSSCGPEFKTMDFDGENIHITVSPVQFIRLVGPASFGQRIGSFDGKLLTQASMKVPPEWDYVYIEIEDKNGHKAWTNTLFTTVHPNP